MADRHDNVFRSFIQCMKCTKNSGKTIKNKMAKILRRPPSFVASAIRGTKKTVIVLCGLVLLTILAFVQFHYPSSQVIIYSDGVGRRYLSAYEDIRYYVPYTTTKDRIQVNRAHQQHVDTASKASKKHHESLSPMPQLRQLINATKTLYPLTITAPYLIENPTLCSSVKNLSVIVIVHSAPTHFERRLAMRQTWTNDSYYSHLGAVRVLFLLGRVKDNNLQIKLEDEFKSYKDLLQGDFVDAYRNLTHKGVMAYKWLSERCKNAKFVLKVDDDITVNMYKLFTEVLPTYTNKTKQIMCNHIHPGTMLIIRDKRSKWYVDNSHFKGHKFYPRYCSGFLVLFTNDVIPAIFRSASLTPFFWVDDVYLYGLVPGHVPGIKYNDLKKGSHQLNGNLAVKCYNNATKTCDFLVTGAGKPTVMEEIWTHMGKQYERTKDMVIKMEAPKPTSTTEFPDGAEETTTMRKKESTTKAQTNKPTP